MVALQVSLWYRKENGHHTHFPQYTALRGLTDPGTHTLLKYQMFNSECIGNH